MMTHPYYVINKNLIHPHTNGVTTFLPTELISIYNIPAVNTTQTRPVIVVVSFGGALYGTYTNGMVTSGDVQTYLNQLNIPTHPNLYMQFLPGATYNPHDDATVENTIDVEMIAALMPQSDIHLIVAPNTGTSFLDVLKAALAIKPNVINISWGFGESLQAAPFLQEIDTLLKECSDQGITVCCSAGDAGSNDGNATPTADFPSSSPHVLSCGGTTLICPNRVYDAETKETVWNNGPYSATGGGVSVVFDQPDFQSSITNPKNPNHKRMTPDVTGVGDSQTGVRFLINGQEQIIGGTSIVAPLYAGYLARIGCRQFVTPLIYKVPSTAFHDIVSGNNGAYQATNGYDLCSGFGSLNGSVLAHAISPTPQQNLIQPNHLVFDKLGFSQRLQFPIKTGVWSSSRPHIASVNRLGLVTAHAIGTCTISNSLASNVVQVKIALNPSHKDDSSSSNEFKIMPFVYVGQTLILAANGDVNAIAWVSSDTSVANVNQGIVTGVSPGVATISGDYKSETSDAQRSQFDILVGS